MNVKMNDSLENLAVTLKAILQGRPILFVEHDSRGGWYFFDGRQVFEGSEMVLVPIPEILHVDPSVNEVLDLPMDWRAFRRSSQEPWEKEPNSEKDKTRARVAHIFERLKESRVSLPPQAPSSTDLIREAREQ